MTPSVLFDSLRLGVRAMVRAPALYLFSATILALAIGLNGAVFSMVDALSLRPLPYPASEDLHRILMQHAQTMRVTGLSVADAQDLRDGSRYYEDIALYSEHSLSVRLGDEPVRIPGATVTGNLFALLRVQPQLGRTLGPADQLPAAALVVVIAHELWETRFGSDPHVLGRAVRVNGVDRTIVGVMPPYFGFEDFARLWIPLAMSATVVRSDRDWQAIGRLRRGVDEREASADLNRIASLLEVEHPETNAEWRVATISLEGQRSEAFFLVLIGAVAIVLLIACANVGNLLLARAADRRPEIELRLVLGATRSRIVAQLVGESTALALVAGVGGFVLSRWLLDLLIAVLPTDQLPVWLDLRLDARTLAFLIAAMCAAVLVFGLAPALAAVRQRFTVAGLHAGTHFTAPRGRARLRAAFITGQVALSLALLTGAGLLLRSAHITSRAEPGYDVERVLAVGVALPAADDGAPAGYLDESVRRLGSLTGAGAAAMAGVARRRVGANDGSGFASARAEGMDDAVPVHLSTVTPGFFDVLGLTLLRGRAIGDGDVAGAAPVTVISRTAAARMFRDGDAVGRTIALGEGGETVQVVGIVTDRADIARGRGSSTITRPRAELYLSAAQGMAGDVTFVLRGDAAARNALGPRVRRELAALDPDLPVTFVRPLADDVFQNARVVRWLGALFAVFAAGALLLTAAGLAGVVAYGVVQRTHELGIRMMLGATAGDVVSIVLAEARRLVAAGMVLGVIAAYVVGRLVSGMVYGIRPHDPVTLAAVCTLLAGAAALAAWLPARRAARTDPMAALRSH